MTEEEKAVLAEAEQVIKDALEQRSKAQSDEHVRAMPHLYKMAQQLIAQCPKPDSPIHLFILRESENEVDPDSLINPLGIDRQDGGAITAEFSHAYSWDNFQEAADHLRNPIASILFNEARKALGGQALFLVTKDKLCANYTAHKLTLSRAVMGDEMMTWHTSTVRDSDPKAFFEKCQATSDEALLVTSLIAMGEQARLMEQDNPTVYQVMLKRIKQQMEDIRDDDDFLGD
jgi:hypothetical protein